MKKILYTFLSLLISPLLYSLPLGNPAEPALYPCGIFSEKNTGCCFDWHVRAGYTGDFVFNRNLRLRNSPFPRGHLARQTTLSTNAGFLALNLNNRLDIFSTFGQTRISINAIEQFFGGLNIAEGRLTTNTGFSWSVGGKGVILGWRNFALGVEGQYFRTTPHLSTYFEANGGRFSYFNSEDHVTYQEWQVGCGLSYRIQKWWPGLGLTPYVGTKIARVRFDAHNLTFITAANTTLTIFDLKANKKYGVVCGATLNFCDCIGFSAEGRWGDEKALYINGQICF